MSLQKILATRIRDHGPMTIAEYMAECLLHPDYGYYTGKDPFGRKGDFTTAPEINQMFGELIGLALAQSWLDQGSPAPFALVELGPGRGTLMADALRATASVPGFHAALRLLLLEASPHLRAVQADTLAGHEPVWVNSVDDIPQLPLLVIANEFFDALPVRQFLRDGAGWRERLVGLHGGQLQFGLGTCADQPALAHRLEDTRTGDLVELCAPAQSVAAAIAARIAGHGGAALIVDYGDWRSLGDTFQALRAHQHTDPLEHPGQADLTTHVDFEALAHSAAQAGCAHSRLVPQGVFLERLGIAARAQSLATGLRGSQLDDLILAHRRLTHPEEMGNLFKVLGLYPATAPSLPGLGT